MAPWPRCCRGSRSAPTTARHASGRFLADEFAKEPFGWDFEAVRLLVLSLLRAGKIQATSKGQTIDSATSIEARDTFSNNNCSGRPRSAQRRASSSRAGRRRRRPSGTPSEARSGAQRRRVVAELRKEIARHERVRVASAQPRSSQHAFRAPTVLEGAIDQMKAILRGSEDNAIATFNASHRSSRTRSSGLPSSTRPYPSRAAGPRSGARGARRPPGPSCAEADLEDSEPKAKLTSKTSWHERRSTASCPTIDQHASAIDAEYARRYRRSVGRADRGLHASLDGCARRLAGSN